MEGEAGLLYYPGRRLGEITTFRLRACCLSRACRACIFPHLPCLPPVYHPRLSWHWCCRQVAGGHGGPDSEAAAVLPLPPPTPPPHPTAQLSLLRQSSLLRVLPFAARLLAWNSRDATRESHSSRLRCLLFATSFK